LSAELETLELSRVDGSSAIEYSRERIPHDRETPPYTLKGLRRTVFLALYALIVSSSIAGLIYTLYVSPLFGLLILPVAYGTNNLLFMTGHSRLHASFIELREAEMSVLCHHSFIHHYRNSRVFHETWLETRMSYFVDARRLVDPIFRGIAIVIPLVSLALYQIHPALGIAYFSSQYVAELLQSTVHEWYHNPVRNRKAFYSFPVYWAFTFLEKTGLASTKHHMVHHRHQLGNLDNVEVWLDLRVPFLEFLGSRLWTKALTKYVPGQTNMTRYVSRAGSLIAFLALFLISPLIYLVLHNVFYR
jgi:hypothetical protein